MIKNKLRYLILAGLAFALSASALHALQINEIRADEPGATDSNEFIELKGDANESLDGVWYLAIGDHTSFDNPSGENDPNKLGGVVEFAISLQGFSVGADGLFLIATPGLQIDIFGLAPEDVDMLISEGINFENSDNVTHLLVRNYTGNDDVSDFNDEVINFADQYDDLAVDIDDNDDGVPNATLPWSEIIDAVGLVDTPNDSDPEEYVYGAALGFVDVGPQGSFAPGMVYRGSNNNEWNLGNFTLVNEAGTGLFLGDAFRGPALDTPGTANPETLVAPRLFTINPTSARDGQVVVLRGDNLLTATSVTVGGESVSFTVVDDATIEITATESMTGGLVVITTPEGDATTETPLEVLVFNKEVIFFEDFESGLGDFVTVSLASDRDWRHDSFGGDFFAEMSGFNADTASDDWLITPAIDLSGATEPILSFATARNFGGPTMEVKISTDFGGLNPATATWETLSVTLSTGNYDEVPSGDIDLSAYAGQTIYVAFHYVSEGPADGQGATYQVDDVLVADNVVVTSDIVFEDFETDLGSFTTYSAASNEDWGHGTFSEEGFAEMSGFGADTASDDWLISPDIDLSTALFPVLEFITARNFDGPDLEVLISANYSGGDPAAAGWEILSVPLSPGSYAQVSSGYVGLLPYLGSTVNVAFRYTSSGTGGGDAAVYQVHEFRVAEASDDSFDAAWVNDLQLGNFYYYGNGWTYNPEMGFVQLRNYPWIHHETLGYMLVQGLSIEAGVWLYVDGKWGWFRSSNGGYILYTDGSTDNLLDPGDS